MDLRAKERTAKLRVEIGDRRRERLGKEVSVQDGCDGLRK